MLIITGTASTVTTNIKVPVPTKTDKPRPHVCQTCERSFARLEHLKRHERSHTKEKPFECPECSRCFARRDLLLRHQQKLHQTTTPSSRPRNRRESVSSTVGHSRARKNSVAGVSGAPPVHGPGMRPRANTISHIDGQAMQNLFTSTNVAAAARLPPAHSHSRHPSLAGLPMHGNNFDHPMFAGMSAVLGQRGIAPGLPKLDTRGMNLEFTNTGLPTAPVFSPDFLNGSEMDPLGFGSSTINPSALHFSDSPQSMAIDATTPFHGLTDMSSANPHFDDDFNWLSGGFEQQMTFNSNHESAIDGSSPSAISTNSQSVSDPMVDGSGHPAVVANTSSMWQPSLMGAPISMGNWDIGGTGFSDLITGTPMSPQTNGQQQQKCLNEAFFTNPPSSLNMMSPSVVAAMTPQSINQAMNFPAGPETPTSMNGNNSASPVSTFTDATRSALQSALSQCSSFRGRKYSFPISQSPLSPHYQPSTNAPDPVKNLPSTKDLQRYLAAYTRHFHSQLPFVHLPTLSFELSDQTASGRPIAGGRGSLFLSMASIGALYELEPAQALPLFENAKTMIKIYLEERRKENVKRADLRLSPVSEHGSQPPASDSPGQTPLWLVQAMLLNVMFGHCAADKAVREASYNHCNALVSLARAAGLLTPQSPGMMMGSLGIWDQNSKAEAHDNAEWLRWKEMEEKKRTVFVFYILQSLLISSYNHQPVLTHSELLLDLPCEDDLFNAGSSAAFKAKGGVTAAQRDRCSFRDALEYLLNASRREQQLNLNGGFGSMSDIGDIGDIGDMVHAVHGDLSLSSLGSLVMIHALHNTMWEQRQCHYDITWTNEETEKLHQQMGPALQAWRSAWDRNPNHNPYQPPRGARASGIALFYLAYLRLHVNLGRSKEFFWSRDWAGLANELRCGNEIVQHAQQSPSSPGAPSQEQTTGSQAGSSPRFGNSQGQSDSHQSVTRREHQLRKAAFWAAEAFVNASPLGTKFSELSPRELSLATTLCTFDCVTVLAEWIATLQDRIGPYLGGILGQGEFDYSAIPAVMFLEEEDTKLIKKFEEILNSVRPRLIGQGANVNDPRLQDGIALATQILNITAVMAEHASVWPVTRYMARCLESHGEVMRVRAEKALHHD